MAVDPQPESSQPVSKRRDWRSLTLIAILVILLCIILPPLVNLSHFDRRIAASISSSLGRPVHVDHAGIRILPTPALTLENFVVSESPAFGNEPVIRAAAVTVTLRVSSLWKRRLEISSISLDEPSINLTRTATGDWNFKGILLQAASIPTAPTDPTAAKAPAAPDRPRFPYVEATHARVNFILGNEKLPLSLTDSDLGLWQANDGQWHVRVRTTPIRTDMDLTDTGLLRVEGTIGHPVTAEPKSWYVLPLNLEFRWQDAPLGEVTRLFTGRDQNWRGTVQSRTTLTGTLASAHLHSDVKITDVRAADVVPADALTLSLTCAADQQTSFQHINNVLCTLPVPADSGRPGSITLTGSIADTHTFSGLDINIVSNLASSTSAPAKSATKATQDIQGIDASALLRLARHATSRIPAALSLTGNVVANFSLNTPATNMQFWHGTLHGENLKLVLPPAAPLSETLPDNQSPNSPPPTLLSQAAANPAASGPDILWIPSLTLTTGTQPHAAQKSRTAPVAPLTFTLQPVPLALGGAAPASFTAQFTPTGYTLHLTGTAVPEKLRAFTAGFPWLQDDFSATAENTKGNTAIRISLSAQHSWQQP